MKRVITGFILLSGLYLVSCTPSEVASEEALPPTESTATTTPAAQTPDTSTDLEAASNDFLIVPGERVGPITRETTADDLVDLFGEAALTNTIWPGPEGAFNLPATEVNLGADQSFLVVWLDEARTELFSVTDFGSDWKTPEGLSVGMPLSELEAILGPFQLSGFGWDYGGYAFLEGTRLAEYQGKLYVRLSPSAAEAAEEDMLAVSGEGVFSSDNPSVQAIAPTVVSLDVEFRQLE
ncbi:hypothetical protein [Almyronema epifaneia]|uniref:Lipoprotein n=1 Tax=Almyronema epifaneia S1 TaxID=2991925 RepID=A0ABW6IFN8_9CYAN